MFFFFSQKYFPTLLKLYVFTSSITFIVAEKNNRNLRINANIKMWISSDSWMYRSEKHNFSYLYFCRWTKTPKFVPSLVNLTLQKLWTYSLGVLKKLTYFDEKWLSWAHDVFENKLVSFINCETWVLRKRGAKLLIPGTC